MKVYGLRVVKSAIHINSGTLPAYVTVSEYFSSQSEAYKYGNKNYRGIPWKISEYVFAAPLQKAQILDLLNGDTFGDIEGTMPSDYLVWQKDTHKSPAFKMFEQKGK